uniref:VWFD domain-containing protein n=1 Tax=Romanomermis culicivorax TaxID=13658 RepID=A0A915L4S8_ROMCU
MTPTYSRDVKKYNIDHDFNSPWYYRKIKGNMNYRGASDLDYSLDIDQQCYKTDSAPHKFTYSHNHSFKRLGASSFQLTAGSKFSCSKYPSMNGGYDVNVDKKPQRLTAKIFISDLVSSCYFLKFRRILFTNRSFRYNKNSMTNDLLIVRFSQCPINYDNQEVNTIESGRPGLSVESLVDMKPYDYAGNVLVRYPNAKVNNKISVIYRNSMPTEFEASAKLEDLEAKKEVQAIAKLKKEANSYVGDYLLHLRLPQAEYKVSKNVKSTGKDQYLTETTVSYPPNKKVEIKSSITGTLQDYKLKSNIIMPGVEPMDYEETLKYSQDGGKWSGLLKKSGKVIFDANSDFNKGGDKKKATIRIKLPGQNIDYGLESTEERVPSGKRYVITSKRNGKDYSKLNVEGPEKYLKDAPGHEIKLMSTWDLDTSEPKEIGLDSSVRKASRGVDTDIVFRIKAPKANYKFQLSQKQSDQMWTNMTILKNDAVILKSGIGTMQKPQSGQLDYSYQTFPPMTPYDIGASINYQMTRELYKAGVMLTNKPANRKLIVNLEAKAVKEGDKSGFDKSVTIAIDDKQAVLKNYAVRSDSDAKAKGQLSISGQVYKWDLNKAGKKIDAVIETPIPNYEKVTFNGQKDEQGKKTTRNFELGWSKNKVKANSLYEFEGPENDIVYLKRLINVETSFNALKVVSYEVSQDYRKGIDAVFKFDLNKQHNFGVNYVRTTQGQDEKWNTGLSCKMGSNVDWQTQSSADWNAASGKYSTHNLVRTSPKDEYKADLDLDTKTMEAKVNLVNVPGVKTPVKGQAKKVGDEEYEVSLLDSAGVNQGKIVFKLTSPAQKLRLETSAFRAGVATEWTGKKWSVAGDIVPEAKTNKAYSIELAAETSDAFTRALRLAVGYPERKVGFTSKRSKKPDGALNHVLEIGSNIDKRPPTKIEYSLKRVPTSSAAEFHLNDPSIPAGVHLTGKYSRVPGADPNVDKSSSAELSFKYSADPKKELIFKRSSDRQITGDKTKLSQSYEMIHDASNIRHKIWGSYNAEPCHEEDEICDRSLSLGAQYPDEKRALQEYSLDLKRSGKVGEFATKVGQNKYKIVRKKVAGGQRTYEFSRNDQPTYTVTSQLSKWPQPMAFLSVKKPAEDKIILSAEASLANDELAALKLNHDENGQLLRDIDVAIWLKESNRLAVRVFRRKELTKAFTDMANKYTKMLPTAMPKTADLPTAVRSQQLLAQGIANELKPLYEFYDKEEDAIAAELQITSGKLSKVLAEEMKALTSAIDYASGTYTTSVKSASDAARKFADDYKDSYRNVVSKASDLTSNIGGALSDARKNVEERASKARAAISGIMDEFGKNEQVQKYIKALTKFYKDLTEGPIYQRLRNLYSDATKQVSQEAKGQGFAGETISTLRKIRIQKVKQLGEMWEQIRAEWSKDEDYKDLVTFFDAANSKLQWAVQYTDPYSKGMQAYKYLKDSFTRPAEPSYMFNKSADGQSYNMEVNLPYNYNSLKDLACDITPDGIIGRVKDIKESVEDTLDSLSSAGDTGSKESIGLVVGDQYFVTFDGTVRTFSADCSYLLARDYIDSRFTVSVEFERGSRKKIVVEYEDQKIEILKDGKVVINGKNADLPWHLEETPRFLIKVIKDDEHITTLETFDGLKVECNTFNDICAIKLKNRFRGKTNGLLGRNDGESYTDLLLPDGSSAKSLDDYAAGWALNAGCAKSPNAAKTQAIAADHPAYKECEKLFHAGHWSPFRKCAHLSFDDFMIICSQSINQYVQKEKDETKFNVGVCQTAAAYLAACPQGTELPPQCVQCDIPDGKINLHATKQIPGANLNDVDVVLAVELRGCMSSVKDKLALLATKIEANLKSKSKNVRFGVAGFSGSGGFYEPAFFSDADNKVNFLASNVKNIASRLPFYSPPENVKGIPSPNNPLDIVDFITEHYPFRPASKKVIVVLACSNCVTFELSYYDLHTKLLSQGYTLYVVTTQRLQLGDNKEKFIGFDASAFIKSDSKPNAEARKDLVEPHDSCTVLAQETNGTVFSIAEKSNIDPVFNVLSVSVGKIAVDNACNLCECRSHDLYPRSVCFACEPPQPAVVTADKTGFFNNPFVKLAKLQNKDQQ